MSGRHAGCVSNSLGLSFVGLALSFRCVLTCLDLTLLLSQNLGLCLLQVTENYHTLQHLPANGRQAAQPTVTRRLC